MPPITRKGEYKTMRLRTTTQKLNEAIANDLLQINRVECHYKSSNRVDEINKETFLDNLAFIGESGVFANFIDWHYEKNLSENGEYIFDSGRMNPYAENVIIAHLQVNDGVTDEDIERTLLFEED